MELSVYAFTCGWLTLPAALLLAGEKGKLTVPVPSYLIEPPKGRMIFDSGLHVDTQTDPNRRLGRLAPIDTVGFKPGEEIAARLSSLDVAPAKIDFIINSHLHFDHCGGNEQLPNATSTPQHASSMSDGSHLFSPASQARCTLPKASRDRRNSADCNLIASRIPKSSCATAYPLTPRKSSGQSSLLSRSRFLNLVGLAEERISEWLLNLAKCTFFTSFLHSSM